MVGQSVKQVKSIAAQPIPKSFFGVTLLHKCSLRAKTASFLMWFYGIFLQSMGLPRSQNNWTEPSSCYLLAQRAVVWCHSMPPPLALAHSPCWVVEFLCWRSCLIDNSICVGVITAWLIGREGTLGHCHYWHTGTTPHTFADGRGTKGGTEGGLGETRVAMNADLFVCGKVSGRKMGEGLESKG